MTGPLFAKECFYNEESSFSEKPLVNNAEWFGQKCITAKNVNKESLRVFNTLKTDYSRQQFLTLKKKQYKDLCRKKKRAFENKIFSETEQMKKSNPKKFRKCFKSKKKILRIIKDMYQKVKSCVRSCGKYSDFFEYSVGLRQGEIMSPILFSLFVDDLELCLQGNPGSGLFIDDIVLIILLFADDMVIFGKTLQELQDNLNHLHSYCTK